LREKEKHHATTVREGVKFYFYSFLPSTIDELTGQPVAIIQKMIYLDGKNGKSFNGQAVTIMMFTKL